MFGRLNRKKEHKDVWILLVEMLRFVFCFFKKLTSKFKHFDPPSSSPLFSGRKHEVEIVAHVLVEAADDVAVAVEVDVGPVVVVVVGVDVVVDVEDEGDEGGHEAHVAHGVGGSQHGRGAPDRLARRHGLAKNETANLHFFFSIILGEVIA